MNMCLLESSHFAGTGDKIDPANLGYGTHGQLCH
jgi:hypothetical protein